jgi:hypothetical protein
MRRIACILIPAILAGCQTAPAPATNPVFTDPASYVDQQVSVCGYLSHTGNLHAGKGSDLGLSVDGGEQYRKLARLADGAKVCLRGTIAYAGCGAADEIVCTDWSFDYAIRVEEVL